MPITRTRSLPIIPYSKQTGAQMTYLPGRSDYVVSSLPMPIPPPLQELPWHECDKEYAIECEYKLWRMSQRILPAGIRMYVDAEEECARFVHSIGAKHALNSARDHTSSAAGDDYTQLGRCFPSNLIFGMED